MTHSGALGRNRFRRWLLPGWPASQGPRTTSGSLAEIAELPILVEPGTVSRIEDPVSDGQGPDRQRLEEPTERQRVTLKLRPHRSAESTRADPSIRAPEVTTRNS